MKELLAIFKKDNLLDLAFKRTYEMLDITKGMYLEAKRNLRQDSNNKLKIDIYDLDIAVNKYEREVRRKVLSHLAVSGSYDLPSGLALISIIIDIERVGDYTKNIVELAQNHPKKLDGGIYNDDLQKVEVAVEEVFSKLRVAFEQADEIEAKMICEDYSWITKLCDQHVVDYLNERDNTIGSSDAIALSLYFRYLKRIYAHLKNVASSITNPFDKIGFYRRKNDKKQGKSG
jgi:phosphate uptake regulator